MSAVVVIIGWYGIGFLAADRLVAQGHSAPLWLPAAAILGAAVLLPAVLLVRRRQRATVPVRVVRSADPAPDGIHVVELTSRREADTALDRLPLAISARAGRTSVVGMVGHEAFSEVIDTGEQARMIDQVTWQRPFAATVDRIVVPASPPGIDAALATVGTPDVIAAPIGASRRAVRRGVALAIQLARRHGTAVAVLPPEAASPALSMRVPAAPRGVRA